VSAILTQGAAAQPSSYGLDSLSGEAFGGLVRLDKAAGNGKTTPKGLVRLLNNAMRKTTAGRARLPLPQSISLLHHLVALAQEGRDVEILGLIGWGAGLQPIEGNDFGLR
jgi:hypothetical protein